MSWDSNTKTYTIRYDGSTTTVPKQTQYNDQAVKIVVGYGFEVISDHCFCDYSCLNYVELPETITTINNNIFVNSPILELRIPNSCKYLSSSQSFDYQYTLQRYIVSETHQYFTTYEDALYTKDMKVLYNYPGGKKNKIIVIPQGVEQIGLSAISCNHYLEVLILPPSITKIDQYFCYLLSSLKRVIIQTNSSSSQPEISSYCLFESTNFTLEQIEMKYNCPCYFSYDDSHLSIFDSDTSSSKNGIVFKENYFSNNNYIKSITFNRGITAIEGSCFNNNTALRRVAFSETIQSIDAKAFSNCKLLNRYSSIFYPDSLLPILKTIFSPYSLGLCRITNKCPLRKFDSILLIIFISYN